MPALKCEWDLQTDFQPFPHFWEHCVGSCHAVMALRADWQKQLTRCHRELGFQHVRFHGLLNDEMGTLMCENNKWVDSFYNTEQIFDFLLSIGMRPFVELSFMPSALSSGDKIVFHYKGNVTPPKKMEDWAGLIERLASHWVKRYGPDEVSNWFFEVWNEPNLDAFWTGSQQDYFRLYQATAQALRRAHPGLQVGGPATAKNEWIEPFLEFCKTQDVPLDFISTHHYPTDAFGKPGDDTWTQLQKAERSVLAKQTREASRQSQGKPLYYTEWSSSSNPFDDLHDEPYCSAFITKTVMEARGLVRGYSYWTFSDIFEENYFSSQPFHGGFGLLTVDGIAKPAYRAFELLHRLGDQLHPQAQSFATVDAWLTRTGPNSYRLLASNSALPGHPVQTELLRVELPRTKIKTAFLNRVDDENANAKSAWLKMGSPSRLLPSQVQSLDLLSQIGRYPQTYQQDNDRAVIEFTLPPQGIACLELETA